ncbi:hypothetical protein H0H81_003267 [Sphagnurus paluster]|uniref:Uncharacterized protein n=1 Tax=Sphagnurus paluster TaxID=117069 RepID=A0A9P7GFA9_9AGAR|nr:hypothetical protein H0H81_003267 [Sphagnurus paluster]
MLPITQSGALSPAARRIRVQNAVSPKQRGDPVHSILRDPDKTLQTLAEQSRGHEPAEFVQHSLHPINPFCKDLPHCNIFACITPDILHQLHNGVFKDHIVSWASDAMGGGQDEIDQCFCAMTPHTTLRHFEKGISLTSQWTGTEHKNMEKVFLGVLANATDPKVVRVVCGILDFIYYAHFEVHTDESLAQLDAVTALGLNSGPRFDRSCLGVAYKQSLLQQAKT